jgi:hypothetical protein
MACLSFWGAISETSYPRVERHIIVGGEILKRLRPKRRERELLFLLSVFVNLRIAVEPQLVPTFPKERLQRRYGWIKC